MSGSDHDGPSLRGENPIVTSRLFGERCKYRTFVCSAGHFNPQLATELHLPLALAGSISTSSHQRSENNIHMGLNMTRKGQLVTANFPAYSPAYSPALIMARLEYEGLT